MPQTTESLRPDWTDPFAWDPSERADISLLELMRRAGANGNPRVWWREPDGLHGTAYVASVSYGMDRPHQIVRFAHRDGRWVALDTTPVMWAYIWREVRETRDGRLIPHDRGQPPKTLRVFPYGVAWHVESDADGQCTVCLAGSDRRYTIDRRYLQFCDRQPCALDQALQSRWLFGPTDGWNGRDGHPLHPSSAGELLKYGRRPRDLVARFDGGRVFTIEPIREWDKELAGIEPVTDALAACYAAWVDEESTEEELVQRFRDGGRARSRADLEAFTDLWWREFQRIRVAGRAIQMVRDADKGGRKRGQLVALPARRPT